MSDEIDDTAENTAFNPNNGYGNSDDKDGNIVPLSGMYKDWFLDYASYVILERAVPALLDGFKPVQRRLMHSMKEMDDGRYNKVANIIGNTMKYHPHGDASIGDALVQLGQKELLIDMQGNWGNTLTGDSAAAARYIEARLSKFASHVVFNGKTTDWIPSYDGRNNEPVLLPVKFPLLLAQGAEGIAVGMACKVLPHNFIELIDASIDVLRGKKTNIMPDFLNGGMADFSGYNEGQRGGKVRVRARISKEDSKTLKIYEIPFGTTTSSLIESILRANDKGKIKIKKIEDNTAAEVEIMIYLTPGVSSPDKTIDALYAFTDCEMSISPNTSVIIGKKPAFLSVNEILKINTNNTVALLKRELEIKKAELLEEWHFASLEKIFIENKIYVKFDKKSYEEAIVLTHKLLLPHIKKLKRKVTDDDVKRLMELRMRRITKHDSDKADEHIKSLETELKLIAKYLANLIEYAIDYFKDLKKKFGAGKERKTEIEIFDSISAQKVIVANRKFYVDVEEGFVGWGLKGKEPLAECSDLDDVIIFFSSGKMMVTKISEKKFVGKDIMHAAIWKSGDKRTIYHLVYRDGKDGPTMMKRFFVNSITRDKEYPITKGTKNSLVYYFSYHPNGEREIVTVYLKPRPHLKRLRFDIDFGALLIKNRSSAGNRVTKDIVQKIVQKEVGESTLAARKIWWDDVVQRLNVDGRGTFLGSFKGEDKILTLYASGELQLSNFDLSNHFSEGLLHIEKWHPNRPVTCVYYDAEKDIHFVKRFLVEVKSDKKTSFISESEGSVLDVVTTAYKPVVTISFNKRLKETKDLPDKKVKLDTFIEVKGMKSVGNLLTKLKVKDVTLMHPIAGDVPWPEEADEAEEADLQDVDTVDEENTVPSAKGKLSEVSNVVDKKGKAGSKITEDKPSKSTKPVVGKSLSPTPLKKKLSAIKKAKDDSQHKLF